MKQKKESSSSSHDSEEENAAPVSLKMQSLPSTRYFNKRISVDFHDIKTIEKPRRLSSLFPSNLSNNLSEEKGYVKFSTIDEEIKVNINSEVKPPARKGGLKKSILKNTIIQDAVKLDNLFDQGIKGVNGEIVSKIEKMGEKEEDKYLFSISLCFLEHLKALKNNIQKIFVCLKVNLNNLWRKKKFNFFLLSTLYFIKGIDSSFLNILVRDGMDLDMFQSFLNAMRENITG